MNSWTLKVGNITYTRVSKAYARKHYQTETIHICPVYFRPGPPFSSDMRLWAETDETGTFDRQVEDFEYYNCTDKQTGTYAAFYRVT